MDTMIDKAVQKAIDYLLESDAINVQLMNGDYYVYVFTPAYECIVAHHDHNMKSDKYIEKTAMLDSYLDSLKTTESDDGINSSEYENIVNNVSMICESFMVTRDISQLRQWLRNCFLTGQIGIEPSVIGSDGVIWIMGT